MRGGGRVCGNIGFMVLFCCNPKKLSFQVFGQQWHISTVRLVVFWWWIPSFSHWLSSHFFVFKQVLKVKEQFRYSFNKMTCISFIVDTKRTSMNICYSIDRSSGDLTAKARGAWGRSKKGKYKDRHIKPSQNRIFVFKSLCHI